MSVAKKVKVISKNVLNCILVDFCCKVCVYYGFKSELKHQRRCHEKKKCPFIVLKVLKVKNEKENNIQSITSYNAVAGKVL